MKVLVDAVTWAPDVKEGGAGEEIEITVTIHEDGAVLFQYPDGREVAFNGTELKQLVNALVE